MKTTCMFFPTQNDPYLCDMEVNIFSSGNIDRKLAARRHLLTILTAMLINLVFWFIQNSGGSLFDEESGMAATMIDIIATLLETIVVMESSFSVCRVVIKAFLNREYSFWTLLLQNVIILACVVLISAAIACTYALLYPESSWLSWNVFLCDSLVAYFLTSVFFTSYLTERYMKEKSMTQQAVIDKLKLMTDNHFVFNSLATLGGLIQSDQEAAVEFNNSMSTMYRYIVSKGDCRVVSLQEELAFMGEFRKNMMVRHGNIELVIEDVLGGLYSFIPPLTLQGLVENAVKHNRHGSNEPLVIRISCGTDKGHITVSNNKLPLARTQESAGSGLKTLDLRYRTICGEGINVEDTESYFTVSLPIIKQSDLL